MGEIGCRRKKWAQICKNFLYINTDISVYWGENKLLIRLCQIGCLEKK